MFMTLHSRSKFKGQGNDNASFTSIHDAIVNVWHTRNPCISQDHKSELKGQIYAAKHN